MKKILVSMLVVLSFAFAFVAFADKDLPVFKAGDVVYVCGCGEGCKCYTMSRKEVGTCKCGKKLVKGTIAKVNGENLYVTINGKEVVFPAKAKYTCACGEGCNCGTVSQMPGKCACGKDMKAIK